MVRIHVPEPSHSSVSGLRVGLKHRRTQFDSEGWDHAEVAQRKRQRVQIPQSVGSNPTFGTMSWFVYIVKCSDGSLYTGIARNVESRIKKHNQGLGAKYTAKKRPVKLVYVEEALDRSAASKREYEIKKLPRIKKLELINE